MPDSNLPLTDAKKGLRKEIRSRLAQLSPREQQRESALIADKLVNYLKETDRDKSRIAIFAAFGNEVNLAILHKKLPMAAFYYPLCAAGNLMSFHPISHPERELQPGYIGLSEPLPGSPAIPPADLDVIIVPGLAFTRDGCRLGKGGGFYDRYLARDGVKALLLGVAFSCQILEKIPCAPLDKRVNEVFTTE